MPGTAARSFSVRESRRAGKAADQAAWVNIWEDDAGRAYVAGVNGGDETVPTVVIDGAAHTNPSPAVVNAGLAGH